MADPVDEDLQNTGEKKLPGNRVEKNVLSRNNEGNPRTSPENLREASYIILFIAAVFVTNAMETGSYRTPWPVAIITVLAGLGLLGYSRYLQTRSKN